MSEIVKNIKFDDKGLIPVIAQDYNTNEVLMMAYMNKEALEKSLETGKAHYFSRSRNKLWQKGETSGHYQYIKSIKIDCDNDALLIKVEQVEGACHTGHYSCFYREISEKEGLKETQEKVFDEKEVYDGAKVLKEVYDVIVDRTINPKEGSYTNYLFEKGLDKILKKWEKKQQKLLLLQK